MSGDWEQYFERKNRGGHFNYYEYRDKSVIKLPDNLPMPPTKLFYKMFNGCNQLQDISALANWDVSDVRLMYGVFEFCCQLQDITALANWNVSNVEDMGGMFVCCRLQDISALANWDTSKVISMKRMFNGCNQLQDISALANWDTSKVNDMWWMFYGCNHLNISNDTSQIKAYLRGLPKRHTTDIDLPSDWQNIELPQWNP